MISYMNDEYDELIQCPSVPANSVVYSKATLLIPYELCPYNEVPFLIPVVYTTVSAATLCYSWQLCEKYQNVHVELAYGIYEKIYMNIVLHTAHAIFRYRVQGSIEVLTYSHETWLQRDS